MFMTKKQMKKLANGKLNIPDDWPRPWKELGEGSVKAFRHTFILWKTYKRHDNFKIYGFAKGRYYRIWWGRKVMHFAVGFVKTQELNNG